jgi:galactokinase
MQQEPGSERVRSAFIKVFGSQADGWPRIFQAPGRINIIGEHTDYNGGFVLPATIDLHTWVAITPRQDRLLQVFDCNAPQLHSINLENLEPGEKGQPVEYLKGVAWALAEEGLHLKGCDIAIDGNIPLGGGLSSSASLELALGLALLETSGFEMDRKRLALLCQRAEMDFVGAQCGIMDQFAIALGAQGKVMMLDCRSQNYELLAIPSDLQFLIVHSGVSHRVSTGGYNSRRQECESAVSILKSVNPGLEYLSEVTPAQLEQHRDLLEDSIYYRARHVVTEILRVQEARGALMNRDLERLGLLVNQSHASLRDDYEVSCKELDRLVEIATACEGVLGSRMMGAGFGGCTISLVRTEAAQQAAARISEQYARDLGKEPWVHIAAPADAVNRIR